MLGGSLAAGMGSLGLVACSSNAGKAESSEVSPTVAGERQFISASCFIGANNRGPGLRSGWPVIDYTNPPADAIASFTLPTNASVIALDLIWMSEDSGPGAVRWIGGVYWTTSGIAIDGDAVSTDWAEAVAPVPTAPRSPVTTRLGEFIVNQDSPCLRLHLGRAAGHPEDTFDKSVYILGVSVSVVAH